MLKLNFITWLMALKLSKPTGYKCNYCHRTIYHYSPIGGMFCFNHNIISLDFKKAVIYHTNNKDWKIKPIII